MYAEHTFCANDTEGSCGRMNKAAKHLETDLMVIVGSATDYTHTAANLHKTSDASLLYPTLHLSSPTDLHEFDTGSQEPPLGDNIKSSALNTAAPTKEMP